MGKKKDKEKAMHEDRMFEVGVLTKGHREAIDRYGINLDDYSPHAHMSDRVHGKKGYDDLKDELLRRANTDYTTMRANEAAALAGDKNAKKFAKNGMNNLADLTAVQKMQKGWHKDAGNGGSFSSYSDFAGLSYGKVRDDRQSMLAGLDEKYGQKEAPKDPTDDIGKKADVVLSDHLQRAKSIVDDWEQNDQQVYADNSGALTQSTGIKETEPPSDQPNPAAVPVDLTDPDTFYNTKMNAYKSKFNLTPDF